MRKASFVSLVALGLMGLLSSGAAVAQEPAGRDGKQAAMLGLMVPADAQVWIEGARTNETGTVRWFRSPPLEPGKDFIWTIRLRWTEDGKPVEKTRQVNVRAGDRIALEVGGAAGTAGTRAFFVEPEAPPAASRPARYLGPVNYNRSNYGPPIYYMRPSEGRD